MMLLRGVNNRFMEREENFTIDFIGIGAKKSATTWLYRCLREHPEVCFSSRKEVFFFNEYDTNFPNVRNGKYQLGLTWYQKYFNHCADGKLKGEFSPTYLNCKYAAKRIKKHFPNIKLIVTLRDPVERALSQYLDDKRTGLIKKISFEEALKSNNTYIERSLYHKYLSYYYAIFGKDKILTLTLEDIRKNPWKEILKVYKFLGIKDKKFIPQSLKNIPNPASGTRFHTVNYLLMHFEYVLKKYKFFFLVSLIDQSGLRKLAVRVKNVNSFTIADYPKVQQTTDRYLRKIFAKDTSRLEKLLHRDLSSWKQ